MDSYVEEFQAAGGSWSCWRREIVLRQCAKRAKHIWSSGSIGGVAAEAGTERHQKSRGSSEYPELGMEAVWKIEVEDFPAFIVMDDKGNDFFKLD